MGGMILFYSFILYSIILFILYFAHVYMICNSIIFREYMKRRVKEFLIENIITACQERVILV